MTRDRTKSTGADDDDVGDRPKDSHQETVVRVEPGDLSPTGPSGDLERHDAIERRCEVSDHVRTRPIEREAKRPVRPREGARQGHEIPETAVEQCIEWRRVRQGRTPQIVRNSDRNAGFSPYWPRQKVVRVEGRVSRTPRIWVQR